MTKTGGDVFNVRGGVTSLGGLTINQGRVRFEGTGFGAWTGPITINAGGTLSPYNSNSTVANITLAGGTLSVENAGTATYGGTINVASPSTVDVPAGSVVLSGTVLGNSTLNKTGAGPATISGTLSPGAVGAVGQLNFTGGLNLTGTLAAQIGNTSDLVNVAGTVNLSGSTLGITRLNLPHTEGAAFVLIANDANDLVVGNFNGLTEGSVLTIAGDNYYVTYKYDAATSAENVGNDVALIRNISLSAGDDQFTMMQNTSLKATVAGNDVDADGDGEYSIDTAPENGSVTIDPVTGEFTYTPDANFIGTDSFVYLLSDGETDFDEYATVTIKVSNVFVDADGVLYVNGTADNDRITVQPSTNGRTLVRYNYVASYLTGVTEKVVIFGQAGSDTITVSGNLGVPVEIYGGDGNDYIAGGSGDELLDGGAGADRLLGGSGNDHLYGGGSNDTLSGGVGDDFLDGDREFEISEDNEIGELGLALVEGRDNLNGDLGNDVVIGWGAVDTLSGSSGDDLLIGGAGGDSLRGSYGADLLYGGDLTSSDDNVIQSLANDWFAGDVDEVIDALDNGLAEDDVVKDILNGDGNADIYLLWMLDLISAPAERKTPNTSIPLYEV